MLFLLLLTLLPGRAEPPDEDVRAGVVEQVDLPALGARRDAAEARREAATGALAGEVSIDRALPHLARPEPPDLLWVAGQLARLDRAGAERASERVTKLDDERLETAREAALTAEDQADALERRVLLGYRSALEQHPRLTVEHLAPLFESYARARAAAEAPLAIAALDEEVRFLHEAVDAIFDASVVPSAELHYEADLARLEDEALAADAAIRLLLIRDHLDDSSPIDGQLAAWLASPQQPEIADLDDADTRLATLARQLEVATWEAEIAWLEARVASITEQRESLAVEQARHEDGATVDLEVEAAREAVAQASTASVGEVVQATYDEVTLATRIRAEVEAEAAAFDDTEAEHRRLLTELEATRADLAARPPLDATRESDAVDAWRKSAALVVELRDAAFARPTLRVEDWGRDRGVEIEAAEALLAADIARMEGVEDPAVAETLDRRAQTLKAERQDVDRRLVRAEAHDAAILASLAEAKDVRRELKRDVPRSVWLAEEEVIDEALNEARLLVPSIYALGRHRLAEMAVWPSLGQALGLLRGVLGLGLVGLLWWALRSRSELLLAGIARRWAGTGREGKKRLAGLQQLVRPATPELQAAIDVLAVWILFERTMEVLPEVGMVLLVYGQVAAYRLLSGAYTLLVARYAESRPALLYTSRSVHALGEKTVKWLVFWVVARQFLSHVWLDIIGADALHELTMRAMWVILAALVLRLLHLWEPELRARIGRQGADNPLLAWLTSEPSTATRWLRALVATALLGIGAAWRFAQGQVSEGSALGRLLNVFYRYRLGDEEEAAEVRPLPKDVAEAIDASAVEAAWVIEHPEADEVFWASIYAWRDRGQPGAMALIADRGGGRGTWLDGRTQKLADKGLGISRLSLDHRVTTQAGFCRWITRSLGVDVCDSIDGVVEALESRPPTVIVLERAHFAFLRTVGGFEAMRALLEILGSSPKHYWLVCFHKPAWSYLSRLDRLLKVHLLREVLELPALHEAALQKLTQDRTEAAGYRLDFGGLVRRGALSGDAEGELERATRAFYRVLGEASFGNPAVALQLWRESLSPGDDKTLTVRLGAAVQESRIDDLAEPELFTLAAIRTQESLTEPELARVNNVSEAAVRSSLQVLSARGLISRCHMEAWEVPLRQIPTVTRTLVHKNLLEWR